MGERDPERSDVAGAAEPIAGRYRVDAALGRGGMAVVVRAYDLQTGQAVALKRMRPDASASAQALFEREYQTLAQLEHPRIIRVFDYGVHAGTPYYTMELLEGRVLREEAGAERPPWQRVCGWLRDVASALALLHSRRLVHRDISLRNVWIARDGSAKLIDFGALAALGPADHVVGTPPFVAPEALLQQPLDGRVDLYGLGAIGYFLLTARHAYPAPTFGELRRMWQRRPKRPIAIVPELPPALSELIMMLLNLDQRGRPRSAAEVVERLGTIAQLPVEEGDQAAQAFLITPAIVGRDAETRVVRKRLLRAANGRGGAYVVLGPPGSGRSRMLSSLALEAKLVGASVAQVRVRSSDLRAGGLLAVLAEALLRDTSESVRVADELAPALAELSPAVRSALNNPPSAPDAAIGRHTSAAFVEWVSRIARRNSVLIAVDDVEHADSLSQAMLAQLASLASTLPLVVVLSAQQQEPGAGEPTLQQLIASCHALPLAPLTLSDMRALLQSLFGDAAHLDGAVPWLHALSEGKPGACMEYVQHLVDQRIVRYRAGQWILPERLRDCALPANLNALFDLRVAALSHDARVLGLGLALTHDDTRPDWQPQTHIQTRDFGAILGADDPARIGVAVSELLRAGVLRQSEGHYTFTQRALGNALLRSTNDEELRVVHARLADLLMGSAYRERDLAYLHWLRAGQGDRAVAHMIESFARSDQSSVGWREVRISVAMTALTRALEHPAGQKPLPATLIRRRLLLGSTVSDWNLARFGAAQLQQLRQDAGLSQWEQTDPALPTVQRLFKCLELARARYDACPEAERGLPPIDAVRELASCIMTLSASYARAFELDQLAELPAHLGLLRVLGPSLDALARVNELTVARAQGRDTRCASAEVLAVLERATDLPSLVRVGALVVITHLQAVDYARMGNPQAPVLADQIDQRYQRGMWMADHVRWLASAFQGDAPAAAVHRKRAETVVEDDAWRRSASLFVEAQLHVTTFSQLDLKRSVELIAALASRFPGWLPLAHWSQAELDRMTGDLPRAKLGLERALELARPGQHLAWTLISPAYALVLLESGELDALRAHVRAAVEAVNADGLLPFVTVECERALALGESRAKHHELASRTLERAFAAAEHAGMQGLPLAGLYEARARIARAAQREDLFSQAMTQLHALVDPGGTPTWLARCAALSAEHMDSSSLPPAGDVSAADSAIGRLSAHFSQAGSKVQVAELALQILLAEVSASAGHFYSIELDQAVLTASAAEGPPDEEVERFVRRCSEQLTVAEATATMTSSEGKSLEPRSLAMMLGDRRYLPVLLTDEDGDCERLLGVAMLQVDTETPQGPDYGLVQVISRALRAASDRASVA
ncbi:MAG TPA: serine/threonine-protein kinase [Polyangiales bacterium]|nr:serine/threonine-protein kinase [Polyangiales bacterium]